MKVQFRYGKRLLVSMNLGVESALALPAALSWRKDVTIIPEQVLPTDTGRSPFSLNFWGVRSSMLLFLCFSWEVSVCVLLVPDAQPVTEEVKP